MVDHWQKIDETQLAIYTKVPFSFFPYMVPTMLIVSPAHWEKAARNWAEFGKAPAGTGPFKITKVVPGQSAEMSRNEGYWDKARIPKLAKMIPIDALADKVPLELGERRQPQFVHLHDLNCPETSPCRDSLCSNSRR